MEPILELNMAIIRSLRKLEGLVGKTPLYEITKLGLNPKVKLFAKLEWQQLAGSVKARSVYNIVKCIILSGQLDDGKTLLDASSGNSAIAYAKICAKLGIKVTLCVPGSAPKYIISMLYKLGADLVLTSPFEATEGAQKVAQQLVNESPGKYFYADQYSNDNNWRAHYDGTAYEIIKQTGGAITHFVVGLGTSGTFVGNARRFRKVSGKIKNIALQPDSKLHGLNGWKSIEAVGAPPIYDEQLVDHTHFINTDEAKQLTREFARKEGLFLSPSSAGNLLGALKVARKLERGTVVTLFPDNGERYLN